MFAVLNQGVVVKTIEMEEASLKRFAMLVLMFAHMPTCMSTHMSTHMPL